MGFRNISAWSIRNPVPPLVLFIFLTLAGLISLHADGRQQRSGHRFPGALIVVITQPGAAPTELETQVTQRVEAAVRSDRTASTRSTRPSSEGASDTFVQFDLGTPIDRAVNDMRDADRADPRRPSRRHPRAAGPARSSRPATPIATLSAISHQHDARAAELVCRQYGHRTALLAVARRRRGRPHRRRHARDPRHPRSGPAAIAQGITASQVNQQLRAAEPQRRRRPRRDRRLRAVGARARQCARRLRSSASARSRSAAAAPSSSADSPTCATSMPSSAPTRCRTATRWSASSVQKAKGYSDVTVYHGGEAELDAARARDNPQRPLQRAVQLASNIPSNSTRRRWRPCSKAPLLAVLVVFLFLRDWRATLISAIAIPLSAIPTFWFMELMGFTLNSLTLLALSLVAGVLVDDAIVEIENIVRHMRMGKTAYQASIDAADEIGLPVVATTFSIVAVFLPVGMMPRPDRAVLQEFRLHRRDRGADQPCGRAPDHADGRGLFPQGQGPRQAWRRLADGPLYGRARTGRCSNRWKTVGDRRRSPSSPRSSAFTPLPQTFQSDRSIRIRSASRSRWRRASTLEQTRAVADRVGGDRCSASPKSSQVFRRSASATRPSMRPLKDDADDGELRVRARRWRPSSPPSPTRASPSAARTAVRADGRSRSCWAASIRTRCTAPRIAWSTDMAQRARIASRRGSSGDLQRPEITITPRLDLAAELGVTTQALSQAIRIATLGEIDQNSARFSLSDRQIPIRVALDRSGAPQPLDDREHAGADRDRRLGAAEACVADISFGAGPTRHPALSTRSGAS